VNVDNLSIFYVFCCLHKIRFFTDINKYYYIIYVLLSCDSSNFHHKKSQIVEIRFGFFHFILSPSSEASALRPSPVLIARIRINTKLRNT
jgi:hypothetical protein